MRRSSCARYSDLLPANATALALPTKDGLVILAGCVHAGGCSIIVLAQRRTGEGRISDVVDGVHLLGPTGAYFGPRSRSPPRAPAILRPCHCTDFATRGALARVVPFGEVGIGVEYG